MKKKIRIVFNICLAAIPLAAWLWMFSFGGEGLASEGFKSLKFFTVLSNLFEGIASLIWLVSVIRKGAASEKTEKLKYVAATSVFLTFAVVMLMLGPLYGYPMMFRGANLFFHLLLPVAAVIEIIFLTDVPFSRRDNLIACIPPLLYGVFYIGNVVINGVGEWPDTNDWYLFLAWGYPVGVLIFAGITAATWLLALLMRKAQRAVLKSKKETDLKG